MKSVRFLALVPVLALTACMGSSTESETTTAQSTDSAGQSTSDKKAAQTTETTETTAAKEADGRADMVYIAPATFKMGTPVTYEGEHDPDEEPMRPVTLTKGYWIAQHETTNAEYARFLEAVKKAGTDAEWAHPNQPTALDGREKDHTPKFWDNENLNKPNQPVVGVDWWDAYAYANWAGLRLPTEAEWEYACRGKDGQLFAWGEKWPPTEKVGNFFDTTAGKAFPLEGLPISDTYNDGFAWPAPVGSLPKSKSWCGAMDMAGNVWEWCNDVYEPYDPTKDVDPTGPEVGMGRVVRGGSYRGEYMSDFRAAFRDNYDPQARNDDLGFRCAVSAADVDWDVPE